MLLKGNEGTAFLQSLEKIPVEAGDAPSWEYPCALLQLCWGWRYQKQSGTGEGTTTNKIPPLCVQL